MRKWYFLPAILFLAIIFAYTARATFYSSGLENSTITTNRDLVLYATFDEGSGSTAYDTSLYRNNGTLVNSSVFNSSGYFGSAVSFPQNSLSTRKYVDFGSGDGLFDFTTNNFAVSFWIFVNSNDTGNSRVVSMGAGSSSVAGYGFFTSQVNGNTNFHISNGSGCGDNACRVLIGTGSLSVDQWHHIVGLRNGNGMEIYADGVLKNSNYTGSLTLGSIESPRKLIVGGLDNGAGTITNPFDGLVDELRIYNRSLTFDEIKELYSCRQPKTAVWTVTGNCNMRNETMVNSSQTVNIINGSISLTNSTLFVDQIVIEAGSSFAADGNSKWGTS